MASERLDAILGERENIRVLSDKVGAGYFDGPYASHRKILSHNVFAKPVKDH